VAPALSPLAASAPDTTLLAFLVMTGAYLFGAAGALLVARPAAARRLPAAAAIVGAAAGLVLAGGVLVAGAPFTLHVPDLLSPGGGLALRLDALGAFFLVLIGVGALPAAL
jgi:hydrogenase-4 component B